MTMPANTPNSLVLGCIADDFTGAGDAASFLAERGMRTLLACGVPSPEDALPDGTEAVVVALKTRTAPRADAVRDSLAACRWLMERGARKFYFKYCSTFDSTPEGNIGPVADALMAALDARFTLACPALPVNGRIVRDGELLVHGVPLHESPMKDHPLTPMRDSRIKALLEPQSRHPVFSLSLGEMAGGRQAVRQAILDRGAGFSRFYVVPDQYEDAHAERIVDLFDDLALWTGGSGLLTALAGRLLGQREAAGPSAGGPSASGPSAGGPSASGQGTSGPALLLAGSCSAATLAQIGSFRESGGACLKLEPDAAANDPDIVRNLWSSVEGCSGGPVLVYSSDSAAALAQAQVRHGMDIAERIEAVFAELAWMAVQNGFTRIIVAGGETSGAVTRRLAFRFFMLGRSIAPGVPVLTPTGNGRIRMVLKSGNFGQVDFFRRALAMTGPADGAACDESDEKAQ